MHPLLFKLLLPLAQASPFDDAPAPTPPTQPHRPMSFSDLQQSLHDVNTGNDKDYGMRNGLLILIGAIAILALLLHLRQRRKTGGPPQSIGHLAWELSRSVRFPFASKIMLFWVARSAKVPFASLLLSSALFDRCVASWAGHSTFSVARHWGQGRLERLRAMLFTVEVAA